MKILQVNCVYKKGSTGKIVHDIHTQLLAQGHESIVCYGRGEVIREPGVYKTCGEFYSHVNHFWANLSGIMYGGCFVSTNRLISVIQKEKPDVVQLHCINGYFVNIYRLITWLKKHRIKTVLTLHAEFMYTGGCGHSIDCNQWSTHTRGCGHSRCPYLRSATGSWFFDGTGAMWRRMYRAFQGDWPELTVVSVSPWLEERAKRSAILQDKRHCTVLNGTDTSVFRLYGEENRAMWRESLGIAEEKVIFHATPNFSEDPNHLKGGYYVLELARRMPQVRFVVAGAAREGIQVPNNVTLLGHVRDQNQLAQLYSMADITLLTSQRETFSMVVAESLCCGTPVAGFQAGGPEGIALPDFSAFGEHGNLNMLQKNVESLLRKKSLSTSIAIAGAQKFGKEIMTRNYFLLYE